mgnify:CR=1 FL=1
MSNTVSTEATLFSTTHPDVVKRTSILLLSYPLSFA